MALKSSLLRNCFIRSPVAKFAPRDANCQSRGSALNDISSLGVREGVRFGRWLLGRTAGSGNASREIALQCNSVAALRVRRIVKILQLYKEIYAEHTVNKVVQSYSARFKSILNDKMILGVRSSSLLGACLFHWNEESISEADLQICVDDVKHLEKIKRALEGVGEKGGGGEEKREDDAKEGYEVHSLQIDGNGNHGSSDKSNCSSQNGNHSADQLSVNHGATIAASAVEDSFLEGWEPVMDRPQMKVWRRPIFDGQLFQYKVYGTWDDVPAAAFYLVQVDLDYRKSWDKLVVKLDVIDRDSESGAEVVHWVTHYPFPMSQRDYVYVRRFMVDHDNNVAVLMSKGVEHPKEPVRKKFVRVHRYMSNMVIKPHHSFEEAGLDYVLTYYDDPQATIPSVAMSWMTATGVPKFTEELRLATLNFVKAKGSSAVNQMFQRQIEAQPVATLDKRPHDLKRLDEQIVATEEEDEEEEIDEWRAPFDQNNNREVGGFIEVDRTKELSVFADPRQRGERDHDAEKMVADLHSDPVVDGTAAGVETTTTTTTFPKGEADAIPAVTAVEETPEGDVTALDEAAETPEGDVTALEEAAETPEGDVTALEEAAETFERDVAVFEEAVEVTPTKACFGSPEEEDVVEVEPPSFRPERGDVHSAAEIEIVVDEEISMFRVPTEEADAVGEETVSMLPDSNDLPTRHSHDDEGDAADDEGGRAAAAAAATTTVRQQRNCNENNNNGSGDDDDDADDDLLDLVATQTTTLTVAALEYIPLLPPRQSQLRLHYQPTPTLAAHARADALGGNPESRLSILLLNDRERRSPTTLRDLVWELSSSSSPFHALQGRDYPGLHAYNPSYLMARSGSLWREVDAFCLVN